MEAKANPLWVSEGENDSLAQITSEDPVMELFRVSLGKGSEGHIYGA